MGTKKTQKTYASFEKIQNALNTLVAISVALDTVEEKKVKTNDINKICIFVDCLDLEKDGRIIDLVWERIPYNPALLEKMISYVKDDKDFSLLCYRSEMAYMPTKTRNRFLILKNRVVRELKENTERLYKLFPCLKEDE